MRVTFITILLFLCITFIIPAQSGPADGQSPVGAIVNTDNFGPAPEKPARFRLFNKFDPAYDLFQGDGTEGKNNVPDYGVMSTTEGGIDSVILFSSFDGIPETNSIPPDPYLAVGPDHIIQTVNTSFRISDKEGNTLATIGADQWYSSVLASPDAFDPKVLYDHFEERWVMVWLSQNDATSESYFLISASDDSDPVGTWYNWAVPSNVNGNSPSGNWADYQGVGYDDKAVYLTSNQFTFGLNADATYQYSKIRIFNKTDLYANTAGVLNYKDFWNLPHFGIRPSRMMEAHDEYYFARSFQGGSSYIYYFILTDPLGNPSISTHVRSVAAYQAPPSVQQLGGGNPAIDDGGCNIRNEPVYRDGLLHITHASRLSGTNGSAVRYLALNTDTWGVVSDWQMGSGDHYYNYPALAVSADNDVLLTYSRSSIDEYMGAYFTIFRAGAQEPVGSVKLKEGEDNYIKTFGGDRNRWGDYNGAWTDPADPSNFWVLTEYVAGYNQWGTWVGGVRTVPFEGATVQAMEDYIDFEFVEATLNSEVQNVVVKNYGDTDLTISSASNSASEFVLQNSVTYPYVLASYDSLVLEYVFAPTDSGEVVDQLVIESNDPDTPQYEVTLRGFGFSINAIDDGKIYCYTKSGNQLLYIDPFTMTPAEVGEGGAYADVFSITNHPETNQLIGIVAKDDNTTFYRINGTGGDAYKLFTKENMYFHAIAYDNTGALYGTTANKRYYTIDIETGETTEMGSLNVTAMCMAFDHTSNQLYLCTDESNDDNIYTIDIATGDETLVGSTGIGKNIQAVTFDGDGKMWGIYHGFAASSYLLDIDPATGAATDLGKINGFVRINGITATNSTIVAGVEDDESTIPDNYILGQNYPNPFNPSTKISFSLPVSAKVTMTIYNVIGEEVLTILDNDLSAGNHVIDFNTTTDYKLSSGIYFYKLEARGDDGTSFTDSKKMILLK